VIGKEDGPQRSLRAMEDELVAKSLWFSSLEKEPPHVRGDDR
jgi:hypothetical protein